MFTGDSFSLISGFRKISCSQEMDSVLIQVSRKFDVHQRNLYKIWIRKKNQITNFIKLDLPSCPLIPIIFIKRYTRSIFVCHFVKNCAIPEFICELTFWRFTGDVYKILRYKIRRKKTPHFSKICPREFSFHTINLFKKDTLGLLILRLYIENWVYITQYCF